MHGHSIRVNTNPNLVHSTLPGHGFEADLLSDHELVLIAPVMADPGVRLGSKIRCKGTHVVLLYLVKAVLTQLCRS